MKNTFNPSKVEGKTTLEILCISDLHVNELAMQKLIQWNLSENTTTFDMIFAPGDFDNLNLYTKDDEEPLYLESELRIAKYLSPLSAFNAPLYFVPGNHDPWTMFRKGKYGTDE